jgi:rubrerythrin
MKLKELVFEDRAEDLKAQIKLEKEKATEEALQAVRLAKELDAKEQAELEADTEEMMLQVMSDEEKEKPKEEPKEEPKAEPKEESSAKTISTKLSDIEDSTKDAFMPLISSLKDGSNSMSKLLDKAITQQANPELCKQIVTTELYKRAVQAQNVLYNELKDAILAYVDNEYSVKYSDYNDLDKYFNDIISKQPKSK